MSTNDKLSPDKSPSMLEKTGVKRVNNLPVYLVVGILTVFALLIMMVAIKRANANQQENQALPKVTAAKKNTLLLAQEVIGHHKYTVPSAVDTLNNKEPKVLEAEKEVVAQKPDLVEEIKPVVEVSDAEIERIRQEKTQLFEEAVKANSSVSVSRINYKKDATPSVNTSMNVVRGSPEQTFKEQLALLQGSHPAKPSIASLGGKENESRWQLNSTVQNLTSPYELRAGGVIPGVMLSGVRSELPGQIIGQVSQDVYDTATGRYLLIPQGTKLIGIYSSQVSFGQDSVLIAWQRLVFPDGKALDIGSMPGSDSAGYGGFRDKVNHHFMRIYGSALLMSGIVAAASYSQSRNQDSSLGYRPPSAGDILSQSLGQQLGEVTAKLIDKNLNVSPTIEIRPGYRFNVTVIKDLVFPRPYPQGNYAGVSYEK